MRKGKKIARIITAILLGLHGLTLYPTINLFSADILLNCLFNLFPTILIVICLFMKRSHKRLLYQVSLIIFALGYATSLISILSSMLRGKFYEPFIPVMAIYVISIAIFIILLMQYRRRKRKLSMAACIAGAELYPVLILVFMLQLRNLTLSDIFSSGTILGVTSDIFLWIALFLIVRNDLIPFASGAGEEEETEAEDEDVQALTEAKDNPENNPVPEEEFQSPKTQYFK